MSSTPTSTACLANMQPVVSAAMTIRAFDGALYLSIARSVVLLHFFLPLRQSSNVWIHLGIYTSRCMVKKAQMNDARCQNLAFGLVGYITCSGEVSIFPMTKCLGRRMIGAIQSDASNQARSSPKRIFPLESVTKCE